MPILAILYTEGNSSSHYVHKAKEISPQSTKEIGSRDARGSVPMMHGDGFTSEPGGIMEVTMWLCAPLLVWALMWLGSSTQLYRVGSRQ